MSISVVWIRELRKKTGAGIMDCKLALERAAGDGEKATAILKELGLVQAKKRADHETHEGRVFVRTTAEKSVMIKIACETDFVARNRDFIRLGEACLDAVFSAADSDPREMLSGIISAAAMKIRENIILGSVQTLTVGPAEVLHGYIHGEGRIGAVVRMAAEPGIRGRLEMRALISDLALHVAAFEPSFLSRADVDPAFLEEKKAEFMNDVRTLGKKGSMIEAIVRGKLDKLQKHICFLEQPFIRDEKRTVGEVLLATGKVLERDIALTGFLFERIVPSPVKTC